MPAWNLICETLRPTYNLMIGFPGRSNALAISERLGLPKEIIEDARSLVDPTELRAEDLLNEIHRQRSIARKERKKAEKTRIQARRVERELNQRLEEVAEERLTILENARKEAEDSNPAIKRRAGSDPQGTFPGQVTARQFEKCDR